MHFDTQTKAALYKACALLHEQDHSIDADLILTNVIILSSSKKIDQTTNAVTAMPVAYDPTEFLDKDNQRSLLPSPILQDITITQDNRLLFIKKARFREPMKLTHRIASSDLKYLMMIYFDITRASHELVDGRRRVGLRPVLPWLKNFITFHDDDLRLRKNGMEVLGKTLQLAKKQLIDEGRLIPIKNATGWYWLEGNEG